MAGKAQKPVSSLADQRPGRRRGIVLDFTPPAGPPPPMPPGRYLAATKALWERFWTSPVAQLVDCESDWPRLARWVSYVDEWVRAMRQFRRERLVLGSTGQMVINPMATYALRLEHEIAKIEEKFGLTPLDRTRLGISFGEAHRSLLDLNAELDEGDDEGDYAMPKGKAAK